MTDVPGADQLVEAAAAKMRDAGQNDEAIAAFCSALRRVREGAQTLMPSSELEPAPDVPLLDDLRDVDPGEALAGVAVIKLNGGLATSMGLQQPKSLLEARQGYSFLEIIVGQILELRARYKVPLPLVLMNSDVTQAATLEALETLPSVATDGLDPAFLQSMVPKLEADTLLPVSWATNPDLEWCPPGHGDVYSALRGSGMLRSLLDAGYRYAMISNSDNLGAEVDPRIAGYIQREQIPFLMEVVQGTESDRKGGHIARRKADDQLVLREIAQTPPEDDKSFRDFRRWRYYNTNTLWVSLEALEARLSQGGLELPVIVNRKTVDPRDSDSTPVIQLEAAMGAAIGSFPDARLLQVPRQRFVPVKTTDDLLVLRSDAYSMGADFELTPERDPLPYVELDKHRYKLIDQFDRHFPDGPPSLRGAERLVVHGDVTFGAGVIVRGSVEIRADVGSVRLAPGTVLEG